MANVKQRHMFPGANTPEGFYSYFPHIAPQDSSSYTYFIKGGPGTGKSTFMKGVAKKVRSAGHRAELFHCSSDPESLDAAYFPDLGAALIDATAPHNCDPKYPAVAGRILDMGEFWNESAIRARRDIIRRISQANSDAFAVTYSYLASARPLLNEARRQVGRAIAPWAADREAAIVTKEWMAHLPVGRGRGRQRRLFATAITPSGHRSYLDSAISGCNCVYRVTGPAGSARPVVTSVMGAALSRGLHVESFHCPMDPSGPPEHMIVSDLSLALVTASAWHDTRRKRCRTINMGQYASKSDYDIDVVTFAEEHAAELIKAAMESLGKSKARHDELEACYTPHMDFQAISSLRDAIVEEILAMAGPARRFSPEAAG